MNKYAALFLTLFFSGCTHYSISDQDFLEKPQALKKSSNHNLASFPLSIEATQSCYSSSVGRMTKTTCSNQSRINSVIDHFKERGLKAVPSESESTAHISVKKESINGFLESMTGVLNIVTLGLSPLHHHDDYTVTFNDPKNNTDISKTVRISSNRSWFSLFLSNPDNLKEGDLKYRTEQNLIRAVLDEAKVGMETF